jgi:predicted Fe-S protein YdhL (DUF1289 family)
MGDTPETPLFDQEDEYVPSPCQNICVMDDESGYCLGCLRSLEEITAWGVAPAAAKRRILERVALRERERDVETRDEPRERSEES